METSHGSLYIKKMRDGNGYMRIQMPGTHAKATLSSEQLRDLAAFLLEIADD